MRSLCQNTKSKDRGWRGARILDLTHLASPDSEDGPQSNHYGDFLTAGWEVSLLENSRFS